MEPEMLPPGERQKRFKKWSNEMQSRINALHRVSGKVEKRRTHTEDTACSSYAQVWPAENA
eukprot:47947-Eustigmatos_ZCMA.PRE.1